MGGINSTAPLYTASCSTGALENLGSGQLLGLAHGLGGRPLVTQLLSVTHSFWERQSKLGNQNKDMNKEFAAHLRRIGSERWALTLLHGAACGAQ